jgi:hypothetical protein
LMRLLLPQVISIYIQDLRQTPIRSQRSHLGNRQYYWRFPR